MANTAVPWVPWVRSCKGACANQMILLTGLFERVDSKLGKRIAAATEKILLQRQKAREEADAED